MLGSLGLAFRAPRLFDQDERALLLALADQCAQSLRRARLYEAERIAREQAQEATRVRDEFLSVASHELRTPLTSLKARAQLSLRRINRAGTADTAQVTAAFEEIRRQAERLGALITQLLDVSRLQAGGLALEREPLDLVSLARQVIAALPESAEHTVELRAPERLVVQADELRLEQVLTNLLDNAVKYSPDGGTIEVEIRQPAPDTAEIAVRDHGTGIPAGAARGDLRALLPGPHRHLPERARPRPLHQSPDRRAARRDDRRRVPDDGGARFVILLPMTGDGAAERRARLRGRFRGQRASANR